MDKVFICGIDDSKFRLIRVRYDEKTQRITHINKVVLTERAFSQQKFDEVDNATLNPAEGTVTKKTGSFDRFAPSAKGQRPLIVLSKLISDNGQLLGYKVADYDGNIRNWRIKEVTNYCRRSKRDKVIPFQNVIFAGEDSKDNAIISVYANANILEEVVKQGINKNVAAPAKINVTENKHNLENKDKVFSQKQTMILNDLKLKGHNPTVIANPELSAAQMATLASGIERGVNVKPFASPAYSKDAMKFFIAETKNKADISQMLNPKYTLPQLCQLALGRDNGIPFSKFADPKNTAKEMEEIRIGLESQLWGEREAKISKAWTSHQSRVEELARQHKMRKAQKAKSKGKGKPSVSSAKRKPVANK